EAEAFTGFDRRSGQDDTTHALRNKSGYSHRDREIGLSGSGRPNSKHQVLTFDRFHVAPLRHGFWSDDFLAKTALLPAFDESTQAGFGIFGNDPKEAVQIAIVEHVAFAHQRHVIAENFGGPSDGLILAFDLKTIVEQTGPNIQSGLDQA